MNFLEFSKKYKISLDTIMCNKPRLGSAKEITVCRNNIENRFMKFIFHLNYKEEVATLIRCEPFE